MKANYGQLSDAIEKGALSEFTSDKFTSVHTAQRLKRAKKTALAEQEEFEESRAELLKKWAKPDDNGNYNFIQPKKGVDGKPVIDPQGNPVMVADSKSAEAFNKALKELRKFEVEIPGEMLTMKDFEPRPTGAPPLPFSADNLLLLEWLIEEVPDDVLDAETVDVAKTNGSKQKATA